MRLTGCFSIICLMMVGCQPTPHMFKLEGEAQGTTWHISFWSPNNINSSLLEENINKKLEELDKNLSNYRHDSTISLFNSSMSTELIVVGEEIVSLVEKAKNVSAKSYGCYDLTVKSLFDLWGFDKFQLMVPSEIAISETLKKTGMQHLHLQSNAMSKSSPYINVDLSSIAQGYSVGKLAETLELYDVKNYLVEIGGEMVVKGHKPDGSNWKVAIERPLPDKNILHKLLTIKQDQAIMTSGTYRHYFDNNGVRLSHILDARTGYPVIHNTVSVTVLNKDPTLADAWSTALLCLGHERGVETANKNDISALFIAEENSKLVEYSSNAFNIFTASSSVINDN
ncbi:FAD:protein FMN transferase [Shewanella sp. M-Br]|uniref:FAD:protein FMN transferase n=1 Tax=Shewanella sp. M-Br TaxID=2495595 RepID=UPI0029495795|nr:FAD:protein FMN transferase [Shewanella sp. M-Br]